jgi:hypothetical protein
LTKHNNQPSYFSSDFHLPQGRIESTATTDDSDPDSFAADKMSDMSGKGKDESQLDWDPDENWQADYGGEVKAPARLFITRTEEVRTRRTETAS